MQCSLIMHMELCSIFLIHNDHLSLLIPVQSKRKLKLVN